MRRWWLFLSMAVALACHAQGVLYSSTAQTVAQIPGSAQGVSNVFVPIPNAAITVCAGTYIGNPCQAASATVYQDSGLTQPITQPVFADVNGNFNFWSTPGIYYATVNGVVGGSPIQAQTFIFQLTNIVNGGAITGTIIDATQGFEWQGAAPLNHILLGNGTNYVDSPTIPASIISGLGGQYYQVFSANGTTMPQEKIASFLPYFTLSDANGASTTNLGLNATGTGYKIPTMVSSPGTSTAAAVFDGNGNLVPGTGKGRICNANGCYRIDGDGTIEEWGKSANATGSSSAEAVAITFPYAFTSTTNLQVVVSPTISPAGDANPHPLDCHLNTAPSTTGATAILAEAVQVGGAGYNAPLLTTEYCSWTAIGN